MFWQTLADAAENFTGEENNKLLSPPVTEPLFKKRTSDTCYHHIVKHQARKSCLTVDPWIVCHFHQFIPEGKVVVCHVHLSHVSDEAALLEQFADYTHREITCS